MTDGRIALSVEITTGPKLPIAHTCVKAMQAVAQASWRIKLWAFVYATLIGDYLEAKGPR